MCAALWVLAGNALFVMVLVFGISRAAKTIDESFNLDHTDE